ncbi:DNA-binding protein [Martelella limonii]|uniref:DNA-binding protein n=1 Tax=Martelella limonii TaxID=1647649 RepID=UPI0015809E8E|nr:DNA-binding protein [Martelella limonii]
MSDQNRDPDIEWLEKRALRRTKAAARFDIAPSTFDNWVRLGWMPKGLKVGSVRRWDKAKLDESWCKLLERLGEDEEGDDGENPFDSKIG